MYYACSQTSIPRIVVFSSIPCICRLAVLLISILPLSTTSQPQPDPKRPAAALSNCSLKASKLPNVELILSAKSPEGSPPPFGEITFQNKLWLACPPPWLRTAVLTSSGTESMFFNNSSTDFPSNALFPSTAPFKPPTYVLWCFV